jgi:hypothetical protein
MFDPTQMVEAVAEIETDAGRLGLTVTVRVAEALAQPPVPVTV